MLMKSTRLSIISTSSKLLPIYTLVYQLYIHIHYIYTSLSLVCIAIIVIIVCISISIVKSRRRLRIRCKALGVSLTLLDYTTLHYWCMIYEYPYSILIPLYVKERNYIMSIWLYLLAWVAVYRYYYYVVTQRYRVYEI